MTPAPGKRSPSSPATSDPRGPAAFHPAVAARIRQLAAQAEHRRAIAEYQARHLADQQARADARILEIIAVLASLLGQPGPHPAGTADTPATRTLITTKACQNMNAERCQIMCRQRGR